MTTPSREEAPERVLLPCPFCGAADVRLVQAFTRATDDFAFWSIECLDCGCEIADDESQAKADAAWNTRADLANREPSEGDVERVARAIGKPLANMTGGCFKPDNGRSGRGDCADGDCYCARVARHCARAAYAEIQAMEKQP